MRNLQRSSNIIASIIYVAFLAAGAYHLFVEHRAFAGMTERTNNVDYFLAPIWILGVVSLWTPRAWAWPFRFIAPFTAVMHGMVLCFGGANGGAVYILAGIAAAALTVRAQLWGAIQASSLTHPADESPAMPAAFAA